MADPRKDARPPRSPADALLARSLSAFHATALFVLLVAVAHRVGALGSTLSGIGTTSGIALFLALWATTSWTTHRALDGYSLADARAEPWPAFIGPATVWGGVNGVAFFLILSLVVTIRNEAAGSEQLSLDDVPPYVGLALFGALPAVIVGAVSGVVLGLIDRGALGIAGALARAIDARVPEVRK